MGNSKRASVLRNLEWQTIFVILYHHNLFQFSLFIGKMFHFFCLVVGFSPAEPDPEDDHDYTTSDMYPARGRRPIYESYWNGRLIPYTTIEAWVILTLTSSARPPRQRAPPVEDTPMSSHFFTFNFFLILASLCSWILSFHCRFDWCCVPKKSKIVPSDCYNR